MEYKLAGEESSSQNKTLKSSDLLASTVSKTTFTYDSESYTAYNGFIEKTAYADWYDAQAFVVALNEVELDGRTGGWTLLSSQEMAYTWWLTTDADESKGAASFGEVTSVWPSAESSTTFGKRWACSNASNASDSTPTSVQSKAWLSSGKSYSSSSVGFVVLRGSSN